MFSGNGDGIEKGDLMSPEQLRMARAYLQLTTRQLGQKLQVSAMAISRFERGDENVLSVATANEIERRFADQQIYFGPKHGVCIGSNVFATDRWYSTALFKLLDEAGVHPSSTDLIEAGKRAGI